MSAEQPTPRTSDEEFRAAVVAAIRELADLIETNTNLPIPTSVDAQHSMLDGTDIDKIETARAAAAELDAETVITDESVTVRKTVAGGGYPSGLPWFRTSYVVHGFIGPRPGGES